MSTDRSALPDLVTGRLSAAVVSDILDDLGHRDHVLDPAIRPLGDASVIAGWANPFLVAEVDEIPAERYAGEIAALDDIAPDDVILICARGSVRASPSPRWASGPPSTRSSTAVPATGAGVAK